MLWRQTPTTDLQRRRRLPHMSKLAPLVSISAVAFMSGTWLVSPGQKMGVMGMTVTLALMAYLLFRQADQDLRPHMKALAGRWLLPQTGKATVSTPDAFLRLFEAVFGSRHLSWRCLWRSALASTLWFLVFLAAFHALEPRGNISNLFGVKESVQAAGAYLLIFLFIVGPANILGDYLSLWETRMCLRVATLRPSMLIFIIAIDAVLTLCIVMAGFFLAMYIIIRIGSPWALEQLSSWSVVTEHARFFLKAASLDLIHIPGMEDSYSPDFALIVGPILGTAYLTSLWLWLVVLLTPITRLLVWSHQGSLTALGRLFDVEAKPFTALGFLMALLILTIGTGIWAMELIWG